MYVINETNSVKHVMHTQCDHSDTLLVISPQIKLCV